MSALSTWQEPVGVCKNDRKTLPCQSLGQCWALAVQKRDLHSSFPGPSGEVGSSQYLLAPTCGCASCSQSLLKTSSLGFSLCHHPNIIKYCSMDSVNRGQHIKTMESRGQLEKFQFHTAHSQITQLPKSSKNIHLLFTSESLQYLGEERSNKQSIYSASAMTRTLPIIKQNQKTCKYDS